MNILVLNTSCKNAFVELITGNKIVISFFKENEKSSEILLDKIVKLIKLNKIEFTSLDCVAAVIGPGSFTGTRISMSTAFGICYGQNIPFIGVKLFDLFKDNALISAHANGAYTKKGDNFFYLSSDELTSIDSNYTIFSEEASYFKNCFKSISLIENLNKNILKRFNNKNFDNIKSCEPVYIQKSQAEVELEKLIQKFEIRVAKISDLNEIIKLENLSFNNNIYSKETLEKELTNKINKFFVGLLNNQIVSFADFSQIEGDGELLQICVLDKFRHLGFAQKLFEYFLKTCNPNKVFLEVNKNNKVAINLYRKLLFEQIAERKKYYDNGDDALMFVYENKISNETK